QVMLGRSTKSDGLTRYLCAPMAMEDQRMVLLSEAWSDPIWERDDGIECPSQQVMIARHRKIAGGKGALISYRCARFAWSQSPVLTGSTIQYPAIQESAGSSNGEFTCGAYALMIARFHQHDENGDTWYRCAQPVFAQYTLHEGSWSKGIKESGSPGSPS